MYPDYAAAYAALSMALRQVFMYGGPNAHEQVRATAFKALELDPDLAEAHAAVAAASVDAWEWERAEEAFQRALALNPDSTEGCVCYASLLSYLGRHDEAIELMRHSVSVNPLAPFTHTNLGILLYHARRYDEAEVALRRAVAMEPQNVAARVFLAHVLQQTGRAEQAAADLDTPPLTGSSMSAAAHAVAGHRRVAMDLMARIAPRAKVGDFFNLALIEAHVGNMDAAFRWLEQSFDPRLSYIGAARVSPVFDVFRSDPRFDQLVARLHLPARPRRGRSERSGSGRPPVRALRGSGRRSPDCG